MNKFFGTLSFSLHLLFAFLHTNFLYFSGFLFTILQVLHFSHSIQWSTMYSSSLYTNFFTVFFYFFIFLYALLTAFFVYSSSDSDEFIETDSITWLWKAKNCFVLLYGDLSKFLYIYITEAWTLLLKQEQGFEWITCLSQSKVAKLTASAKLKPKLNPVWYAPPKAIIN